MKVHITERVDRLQVCLVHTPLAGYNNSRNPHGMHIEGIDKLLTNASKIV